MIVDEARRERAATARIARRALTPEQAREARLSLESNRDIGRRFGVSTELMYLCRLGQTYGPLLPDEQAAQEARERGPSQATENTYQAFHALKVGACFPVRGRPDLADRFDAIDALDAAHECPCGRLPSDRTPPCGCWPQEHLAPVVPLPVPETLPERKAA